MVSAKRVVANVFSGIFINITRVVIQLIMLPLMGRLLGPEQLGLYALAMPIITFVLVLADAGLGESLAREKSDNTKVWSSAFWALFVAGIVLALVVYGSSFVIAQVAGQPRLPEIMLPLSLTLIMVSLTVIPGAIMLRDGQMVNGAIGNFVSSVVSAGLAIYMAFHGFGVWALVAQMVSMFFIRMVMVNLFYLYIPTFEFSFKALLGHLNVSTAILGSRLLELGTRIGENTIVSRTSGATVLGTYGYANQIGRFFSDSIGNPVWANLYYMAINAKPEDIPRQYVRTHRLVSLLLFPGSVLAALALPTLIPMVMGPKWHDSIRPMMLLLVTYPFLAMAGQYGAVMFARNKSKVVMTGLIGYCAARIVVVIATFKFGVMGMAIGLSVCNLAYYLWVMVVVSPIVGNTVAEFARAVVGPLTASVVIGIGALMLLGSAPSVLWLATVEVIAIVAYVILLYFLDRQGLLEDLNIAAGLLHRKRSA